MLAYPVPRAPPDLLHVRLGAGKGEGNQGNERAMREEGGGGAYPVHVLVEVDVVEHDESLVIVAHEELLQG
eukprot:705862-Hanusia_phi.AAC.2